MFVLKKPCKSCPFRTDVSPYLNRARAQEIAASLEHHSFPCHKTVDHDAVDCEHEEGQWVGWRDKWQHCAGAEIMREKMDRPGDMLQISQRLGLRDPSRLRMDSPVFADEQDFIDHHGRNG